jgi:hypothetical protein
MELSQVRALFNGLNFKAKAEPLTADQVKAVEQQLKIAFPNAYRDFLLWMGKSQAGVQLTADWRPDDLPRLRPKALKMLEDNKFPEKLPDDAFVFWMSQGYIFNFIRLSKGDSSPVYRYHSTLDTTTFTEIYPSFPDWLAAQIQEHVDKLKSLGRQW